MRVLAIVGISVLLIGRQVAAQGNPAGMQPSTAAAPRPDPNDTNTADRLFVYLVCTGGMAEVDAAKAAEKNATSTAVKDFARRMADDHAKANDQLKRIAGNADLSWPKEPDPDHKAMLAGLNKLSGAAFDRAYMQNQLVDHQKTAQLLEWVIGSGQNAPLRTYASDTLPTVLEHLEMAQAIIATMTGTGPQGLAAAGAPQTPPEPMRTGLKEPPGAKRVDR